MKRRRRLMMNVTQGFVLIELFVHLKMKIERIPACFV
jgi:hypothetical protein